MKDKAIKAIRKFFEDYGKNVSTGTLSEPVYNEWNDECFTAGATIGWLTIECDHSTTGWLQHEAGGYSDNLAGPFEASEPHFVVKVCITDDVDTTLAQAAFLNLLPEDTVLVALSSTGYDYLDYITDAVKELLG